MITIAELDGTVHKQPAYGKDMQGALSRLMNTERTVKIEKKLETNTGIIFLAWIILMGLPTVFVEQHTPWFLLYSMGSIFLMMIVAVFWYNYIKKGE
jgi:membrane-associated phospholipid phosphatase